MRCCFCCSHIYITRVTPPTLLTAYGPNSVVSSNKCLRTFRELVVPATSGSSNLGLLDPENDIITITRNVGDSSAVNQVWLRRRLETSWRTLVRQLLHRHYWRHSYLIVVTLTTQIRSRAIRSTEVPFILRDEWKGIGLLRRRHMSVCSRYESSLTRTSSLSLRIFMFCSRATTSRYGSHYLVGLNDTHCITKPAFSRWIEKKKKKVQLYSI